MADVLWLDSSIIRLGSSKLEALAELARRKGVRVVVHAHVHLEICRYQRGSRRAQHWDFAQSVISSFLDDLGITVASTTMDRVTAEAWAQRLDQRYQDDSAWQKAKLETFKARLPEGLRSSATKVPMTTDWLVALEVEDRNAWVAVKDNGPEWSALRDAHPCRALPYPAAMQWLEDQPDVAPPPSSG